MGYPVDTNLCYLIEPFGTTSGRTIPHTGDDWARRKVDGKVIAIAPPIFAAFSGTVVFAAWHGVAGNRIIIRYWFGLYGDYGHMQALHVKKGDTVNEGQHIGDLGGTGRVTGPHLHYTQSTNLAVLLKGIYPYWKSPANGNILWKSVDAWAASSGLRRPDYRHSDKGSSPLDTQKNGFLMALSDADQDEVLRLARENATAIKSLQLWQEATRNEQLYDNNTQSKADRLQRSVDSIANAIDGQRPKIERLHDYFFGIGPGERYDFASHLRNTMNSIHDVVRGVSTKLGIKQ